MRQNAFAVGLYAPDPTWGAYNAPPESLAVFGEGNGKGEMERVRDGKGTEVVV